MSLTSKQRETASSIRQDFDRGYQDRAGQFMAHYARAFGLTDWDYAEFSRLCGFPLPGEPVMTSGSNIEALADELSKRIRAGYIVTLRNLLRAIRDDATVRGIIREWLRRVES